jgi:hypothetical protein
LRTEVNVLRGKDVLVLLKLAAAGRSQTVRAVGEALGTPHSTVQDSVKRLRSFGLLADGRDAALNRLQVLEFLSHGLRWIAPGQVEAFAKGLPTARSAEPLKSKLLADGEVFVMPFEEGLQFGRAVKPIDPAAPYAASKDAALHELLALSDAIRIGDARSRSIAAKELQARL